MPASLADGDGAFEHLIGSAGTVDRLGEVKVMRGGEVKSIGEDEGEQFCKSLCSSALADSIVLEPWSADSQSGE